MTMNNTSINQIDYGICLSNLNFTSPDVLRTRFYLISLFASSLAAVSVFENILLVFVFLTRPSFQGTHFLYLAIVAIFDVIHGISYVLTMGIGIMYEYWEDYHLKNIWLTYLIPVYTLSHVIMCSSAYLLVAASCERYLTAHWLSSFCSLRGRLFAILGAIAVGLTTKGSIFFEFKVVHLEQCWGDAEYVIRPTDMTSEYRRIWAFYYRNIVSIFLPFILLVALNSGIVLQRKCTMILIEPDEAGKNHWKIGFRKTPAGLHNLRSCSLRPGKTALMTNRWVHKAKSRVKKSATRTFIVIIAEHLLLASLSVFVTLWEFIDQTSLDNYYYEFYTMATDLSSIFTVVACAIRLPTYCICDFTFRKELTIMIRHFLNGCRRRKLSKSSEIFLDDLIGRKISRQRMTTGRAPVPQTRAALLRSKSTGSQARPTNEGPSAGFSGAVFEAMMKKKLDAMTPSPPQEERQRKNSFLRAVLALRDKEKLENSQNFSESPDFGNASPPEKKQPNLPSVVMITKMRHDVQLLRKKEDDDFVDSKSAAIDYWKAMQKKH